MEKKFSSRSWVFLLAGVASLLLGGCGKSTNSSSAESTPASTDSSTASSSSSSAAPIEDATLVDHIAITKDTLKSAYQVGDAVDFSTLSIDTYNKKNVKLNTYTYAASAAAFTLGSIDTSSVGTRKFILIFAASHPVANFTVTMEYTVVTNQKKVVTQIKIADSFKTTYTKGEVVDYSALAISLLNADNEVLSYLLAKDGALITHTDIDTSVVTTTGNFTVTYTPAGEGATALTDSLTYTIKDVTHPTNWGSNAKYTAFQTANSNTSDAMDGGDAFISKTTFKIGTLNQINLCPAVKEYDADAGKVVNYTTYLPEGTTITLAKAAAPTTYLTLSDYFSDTDLQLLKSGGYIDFKDNVEEGSYELTFSYGDDKQSFPDIVYDFDLLKAYNVTKAAELMVANNQSTIFTTDDILNFKKANNLPEANIEKVIIQDDIELGVDALPSSFVWQTGEPNDTNYVGTLKDWTYFYQHLLTDEYPSFEVYGNLHKVSLANLPFIESDADNPGVNDGHTHDATKPIEPHASLFMTYASDSTGLKKASNGTYRSLFQDVAFVGNQGVDGDSKWSTQSGMIFLKPFTYTVMKNANVNHFFTTVVNGGYAGYTATENVANPALRDPKLWLIDSRLHDTYSTMIFNYSASSTYCIHSELMNAGGPLIINQSPSYIASPVAASDNPNDVTKTTYEGTWFKADSTSHLENYVTGQGGWFALYGAESTMASLGSISSLFEATFGMTFKPTVDSVAKYNMIAVNMGLTGSLSGSDPAFYGGTSLQGTASSTANYWDDDATKWPTISEGTAYIDYGNKADVATYVVSGVEEGIKNYDFMNTFLAQYIANGGIRAPIFKTHGTDDQFIFGAIDTEAPANSKLYNTHNLYVYATAGTADPTSFTDAEKLNITGSSYLGIYYDMYKAAIVASPADYIGSSAFGLVLGFSAVSA